MRYTWCSGPMLTVKVYYTCHFFPLIVLSVLFCDCILTLFLGFPAVQWCVHCRIGAVSLRLRLLLENQINNSIIVKINPLKSSLFIFTIQLCQLKGTISVAQKLVPVFTLPLTVSVLLFPSHLLCLKQHFVINLLLLLFCHSLCITPPKESSRTSTLF